MQFTSLLIGTEFKKSPDIFDPVSPTRHGTERPKNDFVISRTSDGTILSLYGSDYWDLSPYSMKRKENKSIIFSSGKKNIIFSSDMKADYKWLVFVLMYLTKNVKRRRLSLATLYSYSLIIRDMAIYCHNKRISLIKLLEHARYFLDYSRSVNDHVLLRVASLIEKFQYIDRSVLQIEIISRRHLQDIRARTDHYNSRENRQTDIIPSRIYLQTINLCESWASEFIEIKENLLALVRMADADPAYARCHNRQASHGVKPSNRRPDFEEAQTIHGLNEYFRKYSINNIHSVSKHLRITQNVCKYLIHLYSGMRNNEVLSLKHDCLSIKKTPIGEVYRLTGETTKLTGIPKITSWVTSKKVMTAIDIAKSISTTVCDCRNFPKEDMYLFMTVGHLRITPKSKVIAMYSQGGFHRVGDDFIKVPIIESDIQELERISPFKNFRGNRKYQVGSNWKLTPHQFRRSLAVYAAQSSIISLPSLKRQLKHIIREMSLYYCKGASNAENIVGEKCDNFTKEFLDEKSTTEATAYIHDVLLYEGIFIGVNAKFIESEKTKFSLNVIENRSKITKQFQNGHISYCETGLGACLSTGPCDKKAMRAISACINCDKSVIKREKLENVIAHQRKMVDSLDMNSMDFRMELAQLNDLERILAQLSRKS